MEDMELINHDQGNIIKLNVGGKYYVTSRATLCADKNSMLGAMFSGIHNVTKFEDDAYFIDADGKYFRYILNFLRGKIKDDSFLPRDPLVLHQIKVEANFFQVRGLEDMIETSLQKNLEVEQTSINKGPALKQEYIDSLFQQDPLDHSFSRATIIPLHFDHLNLDKVSFDHYHFRHDVSFRNCSLVEASFRSCNFKKSADFCNADLRRCDFRHSNIDMSFIECYTSGNFKFNGCKNTNDVFFGNEFFFAFLKKVNGMN